eukprot:6479753-Amphidinium_carterae.1
MATPHVAHGEAPQVRVLWGLSLSCFALSKCTHTGNRGFPEKEWGPANQRPIARSWHIKNGPSNIGAKRVESSTPRSVNSETGSSQLPDAPQLVFSCFQNLRADIEVALKKRQDCNDIRAPDSSEGAAGQSFDLAPRKVIELSQRELACEPCHPSFALQRSDHSRDVVSLKEV